MLVNLEISISVIWWKLCINSLSTMNHKRIKLLSWCHLNYILILVCMESLLLLYFFLNLKFLKLFIRYKTCISLHSWNRMYFFCLFLLYFHNILDLIFKLKLGYFAIRCNLFIYMNRMWIEKKIKINLHAQHTIRLRLDYIFTRGLIAINGLASLHFKMYLHPVVQW